MRNSTRYRTNTGLVLLILAVLLGLSACTGDNNHTYQGYVEGDFVYVSPAIGGTLETLAVTKGQKVKMDELLFSLDNTSELAAVRQAEQEVKRASDNLANMQKGGRPSEISAIQARLNQAAASLSFARADYERKEKLYKDRTISADERDRARTDYQQKSQVVNQISAELRTAKLGGRSDEINAAEAEVNATQARLDQVRWSLDQKRSVSPASGLVFDTLYRPGEWVATGRPVVSLLPPENIKVIFFVSETIVGSLVVGGQVLVMVDGIDAPLEAKITYISPQAEYTPPVIYSSRNRAKLVFMVEARSDQTGSLHPGQPVDVRILDSGGGDAKP